MATSQNGWPALSSGSKLIHRWKGYDGFDEELPLRNGSAGFILMFIVMFLDDRVEDVDDNHPLDDWGYAYRPIRGYESGLSNHSSATAVDVNATKHPLGKRKTFTQEQINSIHRFLQRFKPDAKSRPVVRWGGDYTSRADEMHFEIDGDMAACEKVARRLMNTPRGRKILAANPGQKAIILS